MSTHAWAYQPSHPAYRTAWPTILTDTRRIIEHVRRLGIVIAGPNGRRAPVLDPAEGLEFNGDATTDLAGGSFVLLAPDAFAVASNAPWHGEWANGSPLWPAAAIRHSARRVVADLFDTRPAASPLHESIRDIHFATPLRADLLDDETDPTTATGSDNPGRLP